MAKILEVSLLVFIPVAWGLSIHFVFELFRRRKVRRLAAIDSSDPEADAP